MNRRLPLVIYLQLTLLIGGFSSASIVVAREDQPFPITPVENGNQILFLGDSITQAGLYAAFIQTWLWAEYPNLKLDIINLGLNGETASGNSEKDHPYPRAHVHERLERILEATDPDFVFICYGMNDGIYHPFSEKRFTDYQNGINRLLNRLNKADRKIILMAPPPFDLYTFRQNHPVAPKNAADDFAFSYKTPAQNYDQVLKKYGQWIINEPRPRVAVTVDFHTPLTQLIKTRRASDPDYKFGDGIHPPAEGHFEMALTILKTLGANHKKAESLLKRLTRINTPQYPSSLWEMIQKRHRLLTVAWVEQVGHMKPNKAKTLSLIEAQIQADALELDIIQNLAEVSGEQPD